MYVGKYSYIWLCMFLLVCVCVCLTESVCNTDSYGTLVAPDNTHRQLAEAYHPYMLACVDLLLGP